LIWYSIPGALIVVSVLAVYPAARDLQPVFIVGVTPLLGFLIHQGYRLYFEMRKGYSNESRPVIRHLMQEANVDGTSRVLTLKDAFLTWELTFYSDCFPESFREHDRRMWQYIQSFGSVKWAALLGLLTVFFGLLLVGTPPKMEAVSMLIVLAIGVIVFQLKATSTQASLFQQEVAVANLYKEEFRATMKKIQADDQVTKRSVPSDPQHPSVGSMTATDID
jgi:hypothetical protein